MPRSSTLLYYIQSNLPDGSWCEWRIDILKGSSEAYPMGCRLKRARAQAGEIFLFNHCCRFREMWGYRLQKNVYLLLRPLYVSVCANASPNDFTTHGRYQLSQRDKGKQTVCLLREVPRVFVESLSTNNQRTKCIKWAKLLPFLSDRSFLKNMFYTLRLKPKTCGMQHDTKSSANYKKKKARSDAPRRQSSITSCIALNIMALWQGLRSACSLLQHRQWASWLKSDHLRSLRAAGMRPESNGFRLHRFSTVSWQEERDTVLRVQMADSQYKCFGHDFLHCRLLWSWIESETPEERIEKTCYTTKKVYFQRQFTHSKG